MVANAEDCVDIQHFGEAHEGFLREYFELENGISSYDTIERAFAMISPEYLRRFRDKFNELINTNEGEKLCKTFGVDGKTQRENGNGKQKGNHIVSAVDEIGVLPGRSAIVEDKSKVEYLAL